MADANEQRDWRLWEDLAKSLMRKARPLYAGEDLGLDMENTVYALDSTTVDLSLTLFPWADFRRTKAGIKLHTQRDLVFLTNNLNVPALTVANVYRLRWRIELFFRWIKGHLRFRPRGP